MHDKPWLTPEQQIEHLERKGVAFNLMSKQEALSYLKHNNNDRYYVRALGPAWSSAKFDDYISVSSLIRLQTVVSIELPEEIHGVLFCLGFSQEICGLRCNGPYAGSSEDGHDITR